MTMPNRLPSEARIREVGPRDGLQAERPVAVEDRVRLVNALSASGLREIEAVSFVSPSAVPAMANAAEVMASIERRDDVSYVALVPNVRGAEMALDAGVDGRTDGGHHAVGSQLKTPLSEHRGHSRERGLEDRPHRHADRADQRNRNRSHRVANAIGLLGQNRRHHTG